MQKRYIRYTDRTVSLLTDNDFRLPLFRVVLGLVVHLITVYEHDHIGVLFDGPGFPQIGRLGTFVCS